MKTSRPISLILTLKLVAWQRPLSDQKKKVRSVSTNKYLPYGTKLVKIGPVNPEITGWEDWQGGVYADYPRKLRGYWTEGHQIFISVQRSQIIANKPFEIGIAIFQPAFEW